MKAIEATEIVARLLKTSVEDRKHTGSIDIHAECSQGGICKIQFALSEKKVTIFEFTRASELDLPIVQKSG
jgi:hypothetical protein